MLHGSRFSLGGQNYFKVYFDFKSYMCMEIIYCQKSKNMRWKNKFRKIIAIYCYLRFLGIKTLTRFD